MKGVDSLYERWNLLLGEGNPKTVEEFEWATNQLKSMIDDVRDDLDELEESVEVVEKNPSQFFFSQEEVGKRKAFVQGTQRKMDEMAKKLSSPQTRQKIEGWKKEMLMKQKSPVIDKNEGWKEVIEGDNQEFLQQQQMRQQEIRVDQERGLERLGESLGTIHEHAVTISNELEASNKLIEEVEGDMDRTMLGMQKAIRKLDRLLEKTGTCGSIIILIVLIFILIGLTILVFTV